MLCYMSSLMILLGWPTTLLFIIINKATKKMMPYTCHSIFSQKQEFFPSINITKSKLNSLTGNKGKAEEWYIFVRDLLQSYLNLRILLFLCVFNNRLDMILKKKN